MRTLAIGDIHGCSRAFEALLAIINLGPEDCLITLGDYIDRGPDSFTVIERLIALHQTGQVISLRGNHEEMMQQARRGVDSLRFWWQCGGREAQASYNRRSAEPDLRAIPYHHWDFLDRTCVDWHATDTHLFLHAAGDRNKPMQEQTASSLRWESLGSTVKPHCSGKTIICGHSEQRNGLPLNLGHTVCIDTWAYGSGWLSCLDVMSGFLWQAKETGETRTLWLWRAEPTDD